MAEWQTFEKAVKRFHKYYSTWHARQEFWPTGERVDELDFSDAKRASALRLIDELHRILTDNTFADAIADCDNFFTATWKIDPHEIKPESRALLVKEFKRISLFKNWKEDRNTLDSLFYHFQKGPSNNKVYVEFYACCECICDVLYERIFKGST